MAYWEELWGLELRSGLARGCSEEQTQVPGDWQKCTHLPQELSEDTAL